MPFAPDPFSSPERGNLETDLAALYLAPKEVVQADQVAAESSSGVMLASPIRRLSSEAEKAAFRKYQFYKSGIESKLPKRSLVQPVLDKIESSKPAQKLKANIESDDDAIEPVTGAMVSPTISTELDAPVVVLEIPFDAGVERAVPLNWKLSRKQKQWYQESWEQIFYRGARPGQTGELTDLMDNYFRHK